MKLHKVILLGLFATIALLFARPKANAQLAAGFRFGTPEGINAKYYYAPDRAIEASLALALTFNSLAPRELYVTHQWHHFFPNPDWVFYYGLGGYGYVRGYGFGINENVRRELDFGVAGNAGIEYNIPTTYFQVCADLNAMASLTREAPRVRLSLGVRYLF